MPKKEINDANFNYMKSLASRVVAESGKPSDEHHIGKILLRSLKDCPDFLLQIDAGTGESETFGSVLSRSIQCANFFRKLSLKVGDVVDIMTSNHIDLTIPAYASMYLGLIVTQTNWNYSKEEMQHIFKYTKPKLIFCHPDNTAIIRSALDGLGLTDSKIITIGDESDENNIRNFLKDHGGDVHVDKFRATEFDPSETISFLVPTSGSTGMPKSVALTHKNFLLGAVVWWTWADKFPTPTRLIMVWSPFQWISTLGVFVMSTIFRFTRIHTSKLATFEHQVETIKKYRPSFININPTTFTRFSKFIEGKDVDLSCFDAFQVGGSAVSQDVLAEISRLMPNATTIIGYGMSEMSGLSFMSLDPTTNTVGKPMKHFQYRLVDTETGQDITEPNKPGELWVKGAAVFKGYYNNPESTAESISTDGWLKSGDIMYRDEEDNYYYVDRHSMIFKYITQKISPVELEEVIRQHPGVEDAAVSGLPSPEFGNLPTACVKRRKGFDVTADEIKDLVKSSLPDTKQLRGGVIFVESLPVTVTEKIDRKKLKELVITLDKETLFANFDFQVKATVVIEGNKLIHTQVEANGRKSTHVREYTPDLITVTTTAEGWDGKCVRIYEAV